MPTLKDLIELMGASWPIALGILLSSTGLLLADYFGLEYLATLPAWVPGVAFLTGVLSGGVLTVSAIRYLSALVTAPFAKRRRREFQRKHVEGLEDLPDMERWLLVWAIANQTQVFSAPYFNPHIKALIARGYIFMTAGQHSAFETPFMIPDYIWEALRERLAGENLSKLVGQRPFDRWWVYPLYFAVIKHRKSSELRAILISFDLIQP